MSPRGVHVPTAKGDQGERSSDVGVLDGVRVVELADEVAEHAGLLLMGLGADVIKVEPIGGSSTRTIQPFLGDEPDPQSSLYFWQHNRGKRSIALDFASDVDMQTLRQLIGTADILLHSTTAGPWPGALALERLPEEYPHLIAASMSPFGETGPWKDFKGSDLVHLALGGPIMNCGYDPEPGGRYDLPPMAPQLWHAYTIACEQLVIGVLGALVHQQETGEGQYLSCAVHEAVAKSTELDLMNWVMRRAPLYRQTCRHAAEKVSLVPTIAQTKDGRWLVTNPMGSKNQQEIAGYLDRYGMAGDLLGTESQDAAGRAVPGSGAVSEQGAHLAEVIQRFVRKFTYEELPWNEAQEAGVICAPLRKPHENVDDPHWVERQTFAEVEHPELSRSFTYPVRRWISTEPGWRVSRRAPLIGEDSEAVLGEIAGGHRPLATSRRRAGGKPLLSRHGKPFALQGVRVLDFTWFLASAGGTRFLSALGAECIKVEWKANPDTRIAAMAPVGGREARSKATEPLPGVTDLDMGGQFNNKNPGKRGLSLNVRDPRGLEIARRLATMSDIVAEGFSPGVMERWGLGYDVLRELKPDVIYAQQSGMGSIGKYGRYRAVGPIAAALSGMSEMSGLPEPSMPAGWGYSYLDWIGAYSFATAMLAALHYRNRTGKGQWIDASQTESGIFIAGDAILDWSANGRSWQRSGNRPRGRPAAPHGIYPCAGTDRWIAIACETEDEWGALAKVIGDHWAQAERFATLACRMEHQDELDSFLGRWTSPFDPYVLMTLLQQEGIPAGVCQTAEDRCDRDPQLAALEWLTEITGTKIGTWPIAEFPVKMTRTPAYIGGSIDRGAPGYGEDNTWVLGELLGMGSREISELADDGVI
jgi:crotonobetainyl-CoA:carnitine CoA-transferase CaiB-like acyl-CoA transferase